MILVCEPECWGLEHVPFNAAFLEIVRCAYPDQGIVFAGEATHLHEVQRQVTEKHSQTIRWEQIVLPKRYILPSHRLLPDLEMLRMFLRQMRRCLCSHLILSSNNPSTLLALKTLRNITDYPFSCQVVLHAELSEINKPRSRNPFKCALDVRTALRFPTRPGMRFIVLEPSIKAALLDREPKLYRITDVLPHPVPTFVNTNSSPMLSHSDEPVRFAFVGNATQGKGFERFTKLAAKVKEHCPHMASFHVVGKLPQRLEQLATGTIRGPYSHTAIPREDFLKRLEEIQFTCFFYNSIEYELRASGALLDTIALLKPIIALKRPIFTDLFNHYGDIGYLCDNEQDAVATMINITQKMDLERYQKQIQNLQILRNDRRPQNLAESFQRSCHRARLDLAGCSTPS